MNDLKKITLRARPGEAVDVDGTTVIRGCSVCTEGPALGHGVMLDRSFISEVFNQASSLKLGLKARFGHPSMCNEALGTYLGRFKDFRLADNGKRVVADMHLAKSAKSTPHGDIHTYVVQLAKDDPEAFGTSIVFAMGDTYVIDENGEKDFELDPEEGQEVFATCRKLYACDFVDEPAANPGGLFSSLHAGTVAGQVGAFLESEPRVLEALMENPEIVDIVKNHGSKIELFLSKMKELNMAEEHETQDDELEVEVFEEGTEDSVEEFEEELEEEELEEDFEEEDGFEEDEEYEEEEDEEEEEEEALQEYSLSEYRDLVSQFGSEIADRVVDAGADFEFALGLQVEKLESEIEALEGKVKEYELKLSIREDDTGDGAAFSQGNPRPKRDIARNIKI